MKPIGPARHGRFQPAGMVQEAEFERSAGDRHGGDDAAADLLGQGDGEDWYRNGIV